MPLDFFTIGEETGKAILPHRVYTRVDWADEWVERPEVHCLSATWAASPSTPEATIYYRYGMGRLPGDSAVGKYDRFTLPSLGYVKIEFDVFDLDDLDAAPLVKTWYGVAGNLMDQADGAKLIVDLGGGDIEVAQGYQVFRCVGLDWLLDREYLIDGVWYDGTDQHRVRHAPDFVKNKGDNVTGDPIFVDSGGEDWTTADIVDYMLYYLSPWDRATGQTPIQYELVEDSVLPDFDAPRLSVHGYTMGATLKRLISRHRGYGYYLSVDDSDPQKVKLNPFTFTETELTLPGGGKIAANENRIELTILGDRTGVSVLTTDAFTRFETVRVVGARAVTCFTVSIETDGLERGWTTAEGDEYKAAASGDLGYPASGELDERAVVNQRFRDRAKYDHVYRDFKLPDNWDGLTFDGEIAIPKFDADDADLLAANDDARDFTFLPGKKILPRLPIVAGVDYVDAGLTEPPTVPDDPIYLEPLVVFPVLTATSEYPGGDYVEAQKISEYGESVNTAWDWSARLRPSSDKPLTVELTVNGRPRHIIATGVSPAELTLDSDTAKLSRANLDWDYTKALFTLAVEADHYCEVIKTSPFGLSGDVVREKVINAGNEYRLDRAAPGTVIGVDEAGDLVTHDGGLGSSPGVDYLRDDRDALKDIADLALQWYGADRKSIQFSTSWLNGNIEIGDLVTDVIDPTGDHTVNAPITSITIEIPVSGDNVGIPKATYATAYTELDVIRRGV